MLAVTQQAREVRIYNSATGRAARTLAGSAATCYTSAVFSPDGKRLAVCYAEANGVCRARLWELTNGKELLNKSGNDEPVTCLALTNDGRGAVVGRQNGAVDLWSLGTGQPKWTLNRHATAVQALATSADGRVIASIAADGCAQLIDARTGGVAYLLNRPDQARRSRVGGALAFTPDSRTALVGSPGNRILRFEVATGRRLQAFVTTHSTGQAVSFSPTGDLAAAIGRVGQAREECVAISVWSLGEGRERIKIRVQQSWERFRSPVFSVDGKLIAGVRYLIAGGEGVAYELRVWEMATGKLVFRRETPLPIRALAFSPDGRILAGAFSGPRVREDTAVHRWDLASGIELSKVEGHLGEVTGLAFAEDGKRLVSGSADGTLLVWDLNAVSRGEVKAPAALLQPLGAYWAAVNGVDAGAAQHAMWALALAGNPAIAFLRQRMSPVRAVGRDSLIRLIAALDSNRFSEREKASGQLRQIGELALPALRQALGTAQSGEARRRTERLIGIIDDPGLSGNRLQAVRVTAVLERIGTPAAARFLLELARGVPEAQLTREAKASLARLVGRGQVSLER
jgi:WD40 repeat protein